MATVEQLHCRMDMLQYWQVKKTIMSLRLHPMDRAPAGISCIERRRLAVLVTVAQQPIKLCRGQSISLCLLSLFFSSRSFPPLISSSPSVSLLLRGCSTCLAWGSVFWLPLATSRYVREPVWATSRQLKKWPFFSKKKQAPFCHFWQKWIHYLLMLPFLANIKQAAFCRFWEKWELLLIHLNLAIFGKKKIKPLFTILAKMGPTISLP